MGTLVILMCSMFMTALPASAAVTKQFTYTCSGSPFTNTSITVGLSAPDSVTAGQTFDLTVNIPALTLATAPAAATTVQAALALTPTGGTSSDTAAKPGATVTTGQTAVPAGHVTYRITAATGTTAKVSVKPGELKLALASASTTATTCTTTSTETLDVPIGTGGGDTDDAIVTYDCTVPSATGYRAELDVKVVMTTPTNATANADVPITWTGTVQSTGDPLEPPSGLTLTGAKLFATIKASGAGSPATATGGAPLSVTAGSDITTLPSVTIKIKPTTTGTVSLTAGDLAIGTTSTSPVIKCTAATTGLKTYTFSVAGGSASPSPSPSETPTTTRTTTVTVTPPAKSPAPRKSRTPKGSADTGAGGTMGPDGRLFILTGAGLVTAAAIGGLLTRRRSRKG
ncbi:hypothetical protein HD597_000778 [Nonomuraea thailandensis]|uniref:Gram-positive cocci surface proteins LPxTG domain-containing protein n=1 Tax=Nonomuraea thailandensis TaxID=1188745 RepID=A0A9X2GGN5_9ACTN|nr:hypothetical protein [Nonomuraea thailandensis]MCP2353758.1 hypothetical protein [Nonomuraea thailandensis]